MAGVFISYAREDALKAQALARALEQASFDVWLDQRIRSGTEFSSEIENALNSAAAVVVLWSKSSVDSGWVRDEATEGRDSGRLIPVLLDDSRPPMGFRQIHATDLSRWSGRGRPKQIDELIAAVGSKMGAAPRGERALDTASAAIRGRRTMYLAIAVVLAVALLGAWLFVDRQRAQSETPTIAVLPFADLSPQRDKAYLAEGLAEEIRSLLGRENGVNVLGRSSSGQVQERTDDVRALRKSLGVTHVLEGSARIFGDELRVSVRLLDTATGSELWSEDYQRQLRNILAVQDEIGRSVAQHLKIALAKPVRGKGQVTSSENYALYLQARSKMRERKEGPMQESLALARQLVQSDPAYAPGQALFAEVTSFLSYDNYGKLSPERAYAIARPHALKAIQQAPNAPEGYAALGLISIDRPEAIEPLNRAIRLDPARAELRLWLASTLTQLGRNSEALEQYRALADMEPLWQPAIALYSVSLAAAGRFEQAQELISQFEQRGGRPGEAVILRGRLAEMRGDFSEAAKHVAAARMLDPQMTYANQLLAWYYHIVGLGDRASEMARAEPLFTRLAMAGNEQALLAEIRRARTEALALPDSDVAIAALAHARDWRTLESLYDEWRRRHPAESCIEKSGGGVTAARRSSAMTLLQFSSALQQVGRGREASTLIRCLQRNLDLQSGGPIRHYALSEATLSFTQAQIHALSGRPDAALKALDHAIASGWRGWYRPSLSAYPALDSLRSSPQYRQLEARLAQLVSNDRAEILRQERTPPDSTLTHLREAAGARGWRFAR